MRPASSARSSPWSDVQRRDDVTQLEHGGAASSKVGAVALDGPHPGLTCLAVTPDVPEEQVDRRPGELGAPSRSGGSNETSTSVALSGTVARKNASRLSSISSSTSAPPAAPVRLGGPILAELTHPRVPAHPIHTNLGAPGPGTSAPRSAAMVWPYRRTSWISTHGGHARPHRHPWCARCGLFRRRRIARHRPRARSRSVSVSTSLPTPAPRSPTCPRSSAGWNTATRSSPSCESTEKSVYPGFEALEADAQAQCLAAFEPYVGINPFDSDLFVSWLVPTLTTLIATTTARSCASSATATASTAGRRVKDLA